MWHPVHTTYVRYIHVHACGAPIRTIYSAHTYTCMYIQCMYVFYAYVVCVCIARVYAYAYMCLCISCSFIIILSTLSSRTKSPSLSPSSLALFISLLPPSHQLSRYTLCTYLKTANSYKILLQVNLARRSRLIHVRGPRFNPGWLSVFHSSLKIFPSLFSRIA